MGLDLDTRQRAMLEEMHVRVWWPETLPEAAVETAAEAPPSASTAARAQQPVASPAVQVAALPAPTPVPSRVVPVPVPDRMQAHAPATPDVGFLQDRQSEQGEQGEVAAMDWPALARTVAACDACGLCQGRKAAVFRPDATPRQADWMVVGEPPDEEEERAGQPFVGPAGQLLDNMLRAVQVSRTGEGAAGAWLSNVVKCRPATVRNPQPEELQRCAAYLRREIALVRPKVILAMGRFAALSLLGVGNPALTGVPFGKLRGSVHQCHGVPVVVTLHPSRLLRAPADKALAWADLCLAQQIARDGTA